MVRKIDQYQWGEIRNERSPVILTPFVRTRILRLKLVTPAFYGNCVYNFLCTWIPKSHTVFVPATRTRYTMPRVRVTEFVLFLFRRRPRDDGTRWRSVPITLQYGSRRHCQASRGSVIGIPEDNVVYHTIAGGDKQKQQLRPCAPIHDDVWTHIHTKGCIS